MTSSDRASTAQLIDIDTCAQEPIRIPGGIQPHGALIVVDPDSLTVLQASANLPAILGVLATPASLHDFPEAGTALVPEVDRWRQAADPAILRRFVLGGRLFDVSGHRGDQGLVLEFEPPADGDTTSFETLYPGLRRFVDTLGQHDDLGSLTAAIARHVRLLTGFDRVLIYRFDSDGAGTVVAEDGNGRLPSFLDLRFPASDIPAQARELYVLNRLRLIVDATYEPAAILPPLSPVDGKPLDLGPAALRSVSPIHLEYMRNMGTGASMSISVIVDGALWGLISAHNAAPKRVGAPVRAACDFLGQVVSLQIGTRERADRGARRNVLRRIETGLLTRLAQSPDLPSGLAANATTWLGIVGADGAAYVGDGLVRSVGATPADSQLRDIALRLHRQGGPVFACHSMAAYWPEAEHFAEIASGLLAISVSQIHPSYIMWFRPEVARTVKWGGDPTKPMDAEGQRLSPRKSFAIWNEQVRLQSQPWDEAEVESATEFRVSIVEFVLRHAEERAQLSDQLQRSNAELEAFSYSISHDLRAPFRHIVGYAELLKDRTMELDDKSKHYVRSIIDAALSAGRLVDDLLAFSQLGRASLTPLRIDMRKLVDEVRRNVEPDLQGRDVEWKIGELPNAWGDPILVRQVVANLVDNALKYSGKRDRAVITIDAVEQRGAVAVTIADNGVGFDDKYAGKLFGVFQRLHREDEFPGTGIGLALAKRVIDRHGGTIAGSGALGSGASFTFTLPSNRKGTLRG